MSRYDPNFPDPSPPRSEPRGLDPAMGRRPAPRRGGPDRLEQGIDRLMSAGRQLVDGVSGARPGSRPPARGEGRSAGSMPRLEGLGRWVENKLDWILEDEDDWREPWQEPRPSTRLEARPEARPEDRQEAWPEARQEVRPELRSNVRSESRSESWLQSRSDASRDFAARNPGAAAAAAATAGSTAPPSQRRGRRPLEAISRRGGSAADQDWPDDDSFLVPRWQRPEPATTNTPTTLTRTTSLAGITAATTPGASPSGAQVSNTPLSSNPLSSNPLPDYPLSSDPFSNTSPPVASAVAAARGRALPRSSRRRQLG
jgi:hypothetical protein